MAISFALGLGFCISHLWQDIKWLLASGGPLEHARQPKAPGFSLCTSQRNFLTTCLAENAQQTLYNQ